MDPREFREIGHQVVDLLAKYFEQIEQKPVFPDVEPAVLTKLFECKGRLWRIIPKTGFLLSWKAGVPSGFPSAI
jgi:hypothetical protein